MVCAHPVLISRHRWSGNRLAIRLSPQDNPEGMLVPCGKCLLCHIQKANEWTTRILHESGGFEDNSFITLTFDDEHLPYPPSVSKRDLQLFFKRLRKDTKQPFRYFACGEYGGAGGRAHYHAILCGLDFPDLKPTPGQEGRWYSPKLMEIWPNGFNGVGGVSRKTASYVAKYIYKGLGDHSKAVYDDLGVQRPFGLFSKGLGRDFVQSNYSRLRVRPVVSANGSPCALPRYYKKLLDLPPSFGVERAKERERLIREVLGKRGFESDIRLSRQDVAFLAEYALDPAGGDLVSPVKNDVEHQIKVLRHQQLLNAQAKERIDNKNLVS